MKLLFAPLSAFCVRKLPLLLVVVCFVTASFAARAEDGFGRIEEIAGSAFAEGLAPRRDLSAKAEVHLGETVATGLQSRVTLRLGSATQVRLGAETRFRVDIFTAQAGGVFELQSGALLYDGKSKNGEKVSVRSPFGLIAVRGTRFFAGKSDGVFGVFVERGRVQVSNKGAQVILTRGKGTNIVSAGGAPSKPARWSPRRIKEALETVQ